MISGDWFVLGYGVGFVVGVLGFVCVVGSWQWHGFFCGGLVRVSCACCWFVYDDGWWLCLLASISKFGCCLGLVVIADFSGCCFV